jgi:hypothetical protein
MSSREYKMRRVAIKVIRLYQIALSPLFGSNCRFYPSCSHYAEEAFSQFGLIKGFYLTVRRLCKCHPLHAGGYDPVMPGDDSCETSHYANKNKEL